MRIAGGLASILFGAFFLLYIYAHAGMVRSSLSGDDRRARIAEKMFLQSGIAEGTYVGIVLVVGGLWLVVCRPGPPRWVRAEPVTAADGRVGGDL
jgi:uncharacterized membrane protein